MLGSLCEADEALEGLSSHLWLQESSLASVADTALGLNASGKLLLNTETVQDLLGTVTSIRSCSRAWREAEESVNVCDEAQWTEPSLDKQEGIFPPGCYLVGNQRNEENLSLFVSCSALCSGLLYFPFLRDYVHVSVRYCFLLELGTFPKAVLSAQYSHSFFQANFRLNFGRLYKCRVFTVLSYIIIFLYHLFFLWQIFNTVSLICIRGWSVLP